MAKQAGPVFFTGTIDGIIFYKLGDQYYSRSKGSYKSAKHMRRNPKYKRTMQQADLFGEASKLVQEVYYRHLPKAIRKHGLFGKLTGLVNGWLYEGKSRKEATERLITHCRALVEATTIVDTKARLAPVTTVHTVDVKPNAPASKKPIEQLALPGIKKSKQARYLSKWIVRRNGRLRIPKSASKWPMASPIPSQKDFFT